MAYKYRIYHSICRYLYWNLEESINAYKTLGETISHNQQLNALPVLKRERFVFKPEHSQVLQDVLRRLDWAYDAFSRRVKQGLEAPRFPRSKKPGAWNSITYSQYRDMPGKDSIKVSKIGDIKIRYHRDLPNTAKIKTLIISKKACKWIACFSFEGIISIEPKQEVITRPLGIDMGLNNFWYDSDGCNVPTPKHLRQSQKKLKRLQTELSRSKEQKNWFGFRKQKKALAKCPYRVKCQRNDFLNKTANELLAKAGLNKSMATASWGKFLSILKYKVQGMGKKIIAVNPASTSQEFSAYTEIEKNSLPIRFHECPHCGLSLNRDHNATINTLRLGLQSQGST